MKMEQVKLASEILPKLQLSSQKFMEKCRLQGKIALITGGASGFGECTARLFVRHGAKVVIADIEDDLGRSVCADLGPAAATFVHCDVSDEDHVRAAVDLAVSMHGRLDVMFNNAGTSHPPRTSILENSKEEFERVVAVNLVGPFLGTKHAARVMIAGGGGSIIATASLVALGSWPFSHGYTCSKYGVVGLTRNAAVELGSHGIRVNCVSPGAVATRLPMKYLAGMAAEEFERLGAEAAHLKGVTLKAEDVANAVLFLASDESRYVTGHNLVMDGGTSIVGGMKIDLGSKGQD